MCEELVCNWVTALVVAIFFLRKINIFVEMSLRVNGGWRREIGDYQILCNSFTRGMILLRQSILETKWRWSFYSLTHLIFFKKYLHFSVKVASLLCCLFICLHISVFFFSRAFVIFYFIWACFFLLVSLFFLCSFSFFLLLVNL